MLLIATCFLLSARTAIGQAKDSLEVFFTLNNDYFTNNTIEDDFYTFGLNITAAHNEILYSFEENAFTNRLEEFRFDESYFTVGRILPSEKLGGLSVWVEGGLAHVGKGILGQSAQNAIHDITGNSEVRLDYLAIDDYHAHFQFVAGKNWGINETLTFGPQLGLAMTPGFRWNGLAGVRGSWRPAEDFCVDIIAGTRFAGTDLDPLKPRLQDESSALSVGLELPYGFIIEWSLNRYGTDREHVSLGYHFGKGKRSRHSGWTKSEALP